MSTTTTARMPIELVGPNTEDLLLRRMTALEELGRLFRFQLEVLSEDADLALDQYLGKDLTVRLALTDDSDPDYRYFHGYISRFCYAGTLGRYSVYRVTLRPWLWFLTRTSDCRIFQDMTVPAIISQVFEDSHRFTPERVEGLDAAVYRTWNYCVQYRESDFDFVSRLMEQEGIYYYFRHEFENGKGKHTLVLADSYAAHEPAPGYESVPFRADTRPAADRRGAITKWLVAQEFEPVRYVLRDYDFTNPPARAAAEALEVRRGREDTYEIYDFPGVFTEGEDGEHYAQVLLEGIEAEQESVRGNSSARGLGAGHLFGLEGHPRKDQNREYLVVSAIHSLGPIEYESTSESVPVRVYRATLTAIDARLTYRSPATTPKPVINGPQTAFVVAPEGVEVWTDKYGRVMVRFHWDRYGEDAEKSSCWIRVAQSWAGKSWGSLFVPRAGQEVIVEFQDGDPDRPLITGQVYNEVCRPPYDPEEHGTMTTLKSVSSIGGEGFNELRFEDKKGEEQVFIHAEKNLDLRVRNDRFETVVQNRHLHVEKDKLEHVGNNRHETIDADHREQIGKDRHLEVKGKEAKKVAGSLSLTVEGDVIEAFKANHSMEVGADGYLKADNVVIEGMTNLTLKVGESFIAIEAGGIKIGTTGKIQLEATNTVDVTGTAGVTVASDAMASLESLNTTVKGDLGVKVDGGALCEVKGGLVKIN